MARITVEDCILKVPNRFDLVMLAAQRARDLSAGAAPTIDRDNDKNPVIALREIADSTVELDHLRYELIHGLRRHLELETGPGEGEGALALELDGTDPIQRMGRASGVYADHEISDDEIAAEEESDGEPLTDEVSDETVDDVAPAADDSEV